MDLRSGAFHFNIDLSNLTCLRLFSNSVSEGDRLLIPIYAMNTDKDIWGADAFEFKCVFNQYQLLLETRQILISSSRR